MLRFQVDINGGIRQQHRGNRVVAKGAGCVKESPLASQKVPPVDVNGGIGTEDLLHSWHLSLCFRPAK